MKAVIVANGEMQSSARLQELWSRADLRIAANGGARNARLFLQRAPHVIIGDMDSLDQETRAWLESNAVEFIQHPVAKDQTDLELALRLAQKRGAGQITMIGAFGGRVDHFLSNVFLLTQNYPEQSQRIKIADAASEMWVGTAGDVIEGNRGDTVSLIPIDQVVEGIATENLEYPLRGETLERGSTRGMSNVMLGARAVITWNRGTLLIVHLFNE